MSNIPSQKELHKLLEYNPNTGEFLWKQRGLRGWDTKYAGKPALAIKQNNGYLSGGIYGFKLKAHRVAWKYVHGFEPIQIDHINGIRTDNRIENLRAVDAAENHKNVGLRKDNSTGIAGVRFNSAKKKWQAQITISRKQIHLGLFDSFDEAKAVRLAAQQTYGFHENHGDVR